MLKDRETCGASNIEDGNTTYLKMPNVDLATLDLPLVKNKLHQYLIL